MELVIEYSRGVIRLLNWQKMSLEEFITKYAQGKGEIVITLVPIIPNTNKLGNG